MTNLLKKLDVVHYTWQSLFEGSVFCAWVYCFFEWLFIVTKPSFLSAVPLVQEIRIFFFSASLLAGLTLFVLAVFYLLARLVRARQIDHGLRNLGGLVLGLIMASIGLLLVDNFTYTVFGFGIVSTSGVTVLPYLFCFLALVGFLFLEVKKDLTALDRWLKPRAWRKYVDLGLAAVLFAGLVLNYQRPENSSQLNVSQAGKPERKYPNIILLTADGLSASHTSLSGYERDTTPRIKALAEDSLVALDAYNNSGNTMGSIVSMYTGKYPTTTRTLYAPDILRGKDAYQHFPNLLRQIGYYNIQYTYPYHADAYIRNVLAGFDEANGKTMQQNAVMNLLNRYFTSDTAYFQYELGNRLTDRLRHITFNKKMLTQQELLFGETQQFHDSEKIERVFQVLSASSQPVFAHVHWMGTHGATFLPKNRVFSAGKDSDNQKIWDPDFYDDSILDFDTAVGQVIDRLKAMGIYNNTILIISSDHSQHYATTYPIPLVIHFPNDQYQGKLSSSAQTIDIAPTLLDTIGLPKPGWMSGASLIGGDPGERPIFGMGLGGNVEVEHFAVVKESLKPPFYQFGYISVVYCGRWYMLSFTDYRWTQGEINGVVSACANPPANETVLGWMRERLAADRFDVSTLKKVSQIGQK